MRTLAERLVYVCSQVGHVRFNGECRRCALELPDETIEENLQRQVEALKKRLEDIAR